MAISVVSLMAMEPDRKCSTTTLMVSAAYAAWAAWVASRATAASTGKSRQKSRNNLVGLFRDFRMGSPSCVISGRE